MVQYLMENRERVASKDDLIASVWSGRIVSESTLTSRMNAVRHAVGDSGEQQRLIRTIPRKGFRFIGEVREGTKLPSRRIAAAEGNHATPAPIRTPGGVVRPDGRTKCNLAVTASGDGPVAVRVAHWVNHAEHEWQNPIFGPLLRRLSQRFRLIRYDGRGAGLSDRNVSDVSFAKYRDDLDAVVDALKLERFALLGLSGGAANAIAYAARYPERVAKLVLCGGYALGRTSAVRRKPPRRQVRLLQCCGAVGATTCRH